MANNENFEELKARFTGWAHRTIRERCQVITNTNWRWLIEGALHDDVDRLIKTGGQCSHNFEEYARTWRKMVKNKPTEVAVRTYITTFNLMQTYHQKQIKSVPLSARKSTPNNTPKSTPKSTPKTTPNTPLDFQQVNTFDVGGNIDRDIEGSILSPSIPLSFTAPETIANGNYYAFFNVLQKEAPGHEGRNLPGLCLNLRDFGVDRWEDFSDIVRATDYGRIGHPIWKAIADLRAKTWRPDNMVAYLKKHAHNEQ